MKQSIPQEAEIVAEVERVGDQVADDGSGVDAFC